MRHGSAASHRLTRGTDHLMSQEVRAPKGDVSPVPQANWQRNHDMARIRTRRPRLFDGGAPLAPS